MATALEGLRVIEVSGGMAGNMAGMVLADNGAEVIKVERPAGDPTRAHPGFIVWNRGKKSVVLDLKTPQGRGRLAGLAAGADALVHDLRLRADERLGAAYDALSLLNPGLVYVAISGFGERGPLKDLPGYEHLVAAKTGRMSSQTHGFRPGPIFTPVPIASYGAAMLAVQGILAGIHARARTGRGQRVNTSLFHSLVAYDMSQFGSSGSGAPNPSGKVNGVMLAFATPQCRDGRYIQMCSRQPHLFRNWMRAIGMEHLYQDHAYHSMPDVFPSRKDLERVSEEIHARMLEKTYAEWLEIFLKEDVGSDPFLTPKELLRHPQITENGRVVEIDDPRAGRTIQIGPLALFSETPSRIGAPAPSLGQHQDLTPWKARPPLHESPMPPLSQPQGLDSPGVEVRPPLHESPKPALSQPQGLDSPGVEVRPPLHESPKLERDGVRLPRFPLEGVTLVDASFFYAAPFGATLLAEMGARVIKIEPPTGDPMRRNSRVVYLKSMQGKESVVLDLKQPEGRDAFYKIIAKADIFLHNFRPGAPEGLKIDYETLRAVNPRLVYVYGSCFGSKGPWKKRAGFHSTPSAMGGAGIVESGRGNPPRDRHFPDPAGALAAASAMLMGLHARERTGAGQYIETTMITSSGYVMSGWSLDYEGKPEDPLPDHGQHGYGALHRLYQAKEGWLFLMCPKEAHWTALASALGLGPTTPSPSQGEGWDGGLRRDPRFATPEGRQEHDAELAGRIGQALQQRSADEWEAILLKAGVPAVRADGIDHHDFLLNDPHSIENEVSLEDRLPDGTAFRRSANCLEFPAMATRGEHPQPIGYATDAILREVGFSAEHIARLRTQGVTAPVGSGL